LEATKIGSSRDVISIIEQSVAEVKKNLDEKLVERKEVSVGIFATPATLKSMAYPKAIAKAYGVELPPTALRMITQERWYQKNSQTINSISGSIDLLLPEKKIIHIYLIGPGNWVDLIEHGAPNDVKDGILKRDLELLTRDIPAKVSLDVVGEFCTHYPVFDQALKYETRKRGLTGAHTAFIKQGPLMGDLFEAMMQKRFEKNHREYKLSAEARNEIRVKSRPKIFISGSNVDETVGLTKTIFPKDPVPTVSTIGF
jgi:glutamate racemase